MQLAERLARGHASVPRWATGLLRPRIALPALVALQWAAVAAFGLSVTHDGWLFYQGGDHTFYYTTSWVMSEGRLPLTHIGYGWPYLLSPLALFAGPNVLAALPWIVVLQVAVLAPAALLAVYGIAARIGGERFGYVAGLAWIAVPFAALPLFVDRYHEKYVDLFLPQAHGLSGLADYPSMVALLVAAYFFLRALDDGDLVAAGTAGLLAGFALGIKPSTALFLAAPVGAALVARRWRQGLVFAAAMAPALLTLAVWKQRGLGQLPLLSLDDVRVHAAALPVQLAALSVDVGPYLDVDWDRLRSQFTMIQEFFWSVRLLQFLPLAGFVAVARRSVPAATFLGLWLAGYFVFKGSSEVASVENGSFWRHLMPAFPAFFLLAVSLPLLLPSLGERLAERGRRTRAAPFPRRWRAAAVGAAVVVLGAAPLALAAALPVLEEPVQVKEFEYQLIVPVDRHWQPTLREDGGVELSWTPPASGATDVHYRVYRSPYEHGGRGQHLPAAIAGVQCLPRTGGAPDCSLEMETLEETAERSWTDRPPPGRWTYRVGFLAGYAGGVEDADLLVVSAPVTIVVP